MESMPMTADQLITTILDYIHNGIIVVNREGTVVICNAAAKKMMGFGDDVAGRPITSVVPNTNMLNIVSTGQSECGKRFVFNNKTFAVNYTPIFNRAGVVGAVTVFQDATELEDVLTELESFRKINEELEAIINTSYDGILITDGDGNISKINEALLRVTDLKEENFYGKKIDDLHKEGHFFSVPIAQLARIKKEVVSGIQKIKTGKEVMVTSTPMLDSGGKVIRVVTNARDMSDIINLQDQLTRQKELSNHLRLEFNRMLEDELRSNEVITGNQGMLKILELTRRIAGSEVTVLLQGESGVGKEIFAKLIHFWSKRKGAFIKVNCSAIPAHLLESELFGYASGAFTGAKKEGKPGLFELADEGTLFLDEIEDLPMELQGKFLRVLQDNEFIRLGGTRVIKVNVRMIAASNKNLGQMVQERRFRKDLYYRLNVIPINIPPLSSRREDIPLLLEHFLKKYNKKYNTSKTISPAMLKNFIQYYWPGNIRELKNTIERLVITSPGDIISEDIFSPLNGETERETVADPGEGHGSGPGDGVEVTLREVVELAEKDVLRKALARYKNSRQIGRSLGISHTAVLKKMKKYGFNK